MGKTPGLLAAAVWKYALIVATWSVVLSAGQRSPCPASLSPCTCDYSGISCIKAETTESLQTAFGGSGPYEHRGLWLQRTPLSRFPVGVLGYFKFASVYIDLNKNLTYFNLGVLANSSGTLRDLSLFGNRLSRVDLNDLASFGGLETLNLAQNQIRSIPAAGFKNPRLETLVLSGNPIETIGAFAFAGLSNLETLKMRETRLKSLDANSMSMFPHNPELKIEVELGRIQSIHPKAFERTVPLELSLRYNQMQSLPRDVFLPLVEGMLQNLKTRVINDVPRVKTRGNRFSCQGCDYKWLVPYARNKAWNVILSDFSCADGKRLSNLTSDLIGC